MTDHFSEKAKKIMWYVAWSLGFLAGGLALIPPADILPQSAAKYVSVCVALLGYASAYLMGQLPSAKERKNE
jgi:hypothetical protein